MDDAIATAYQMGITTGSTNSTMTDIRVTYTIQHAHATNCYPVASYYLTDNKSDKYRDDTRVWAHCNICGGSWRHDGPKDDYNGRAKNGAIADYQQHLLNGTWCTVKGVACGKNEGLYETSDTASLGVGDTVISAKIEF